MRRAQLHQVEKLIANRIYVGAATYATDLLDIREITHDECQIIIRRVLMTAIRTGDIHVAQDIRDVFEMEMFPEDVWQIDALVDDFLAIDGVETFDAPLLAAVA